MARLRREHQEIERELKELRQFVDALAERSGVSREALDPDSPGSAATSQASRTASAAGGGGGAGGGAGGVLQGAGDRIASRGQRSVGPAGTLLRRAGTAGKALGGALAATAVAPQAFQLAGQALGLPGGSKVAEALEGVLPVQRLIDEGKGVREAVGVAQAFGQAGIPLSAQQLGSVQDRATQRAQVDRAQERNEQVTGLTRNAQAIKSFLGSLGSQGEEKEEAAAAAEREVTVDFEGAPERLGDFVEDTARATGVGQGTSAKIGFGVETVAGAAVQAVQTAASFWSSKFDSDDGGDPLEKMREKGPDN